MKLSLKSPAAVLLITAVILLAGWGAMVYFDARPNENSGLRPADREEAAAPPAPVQENPEVELSTSESAPAPHIADRPATSRDPKVQPQPRINRPGAPRLSMPLELEQELTDWKEQALAILENSKTYEDGKLGANISEGDRAHLKAELERVLQGSYDHKAAILQGLLDSSGMSNEAGALYQGALQNDIAFTMGKVWADHDAAGTAAFLQQQGVDDGPLAEGWLYSRLQSGDYSPGEFENMGFDLDHAALSRTMQALSQEDQLGALDVMFTMPEPVQDDHELWHSLLKSASTFSDPQAATWLDENADRLEGLDAGKLFKALRQINPEAYKSVYSAPEADYIQVLMDENNYPQAASTLTELSSDYDNTIEFDKARILMWKWVQSDPDAALVWFSENQDAVQSAEEVYKIAYREYGKSNYENAVDSALHVEDDFRRGMALSNVIIGEVMKQGHDIKPDWINELPPGFTKARTVAGYVLGLSRHANDLDLEADIKYQFMQNEFDLPFITQRVTASKLSREEIDAALQLLNNY